MAIWIKIRKIKSFNNVADYIVYGSGNNESDCYMRIDRKNKTLGFYESDNFKSLIHSLDASDEDSPIGSVPHMRIVTFSRVVLQGLKVLKMDDWPDILDYCA